MTCDMPVSRVDDGLVGDHSIISTIQQCGGAKMDGEIRIPPLDPERDWKSDRSGMLSTGRRNVVEREPDMAEPECVLELAIDRIVRILLELVGVTG